MFFYKKLQDVGLCDICLRKKVNVTLETSLQGHAFHIDRDEYDFEYLSLFLNTVHHYRNTHH